MVSKKIPISLQLYSVREDCAKDLLGTIAKVGKMGYDGVEFAGFHGHSATDIKQALDAAGLKATGSHTGIDSLSDENWEATSEFHAAIGCDNLIVPWLPEETRATPEACLATAERFKTITERLKTKGQRTGFHAHSGDMKPLEGGVSAWYLLAQNTPTEFLMQYDTANGMQGGADPVQPILDFPGRGQIVHLKEWNGAHGALIGEGEIPWERVFDACESVAGTEWYVVEHESELEIPPIEAVDRCLQNLRKMGK